MKDSHPLTTQELVQTLGLSYLDEMKSDYEHDCHWLLQLQPDLKPGSRNLLNKVKASIKVVIQDIEMLQQQISREGTEIISPGAAQQTPKERNEEISRN